MQYYGTRLSENISRREPEGYLLCLNVPVARTGMQEYLPEELGLPPGPAPVPVFRPEAEVFSPETLASFEGMPVTNDHPPDGVDLGNIRALQKGHAHNVRRGSGEESDLLLADLIITDERLIDAILAGKREISCGYTYELAEENGQYFQRMIRGNHIAVVDAGRAGPRVSIRDQHPEKKERPERRTENMKKSLTRLLARMARDGDVETVAEFIGEMIGEEAETPAAEAAEAAAEAAEAVAEAAKAAENAEVAETAENVGNVETPAADEVSFADILQKLDRIIELLSPAPVTEPEAPEVPAGDEDPAEAVAEALEEALEAAEAAEAAAVPEEAPEEISRLLEAVLDPAVSVTLEEAGTGEEPEGDCGTPRLSEDALRSAIRSIRPLLARMPREQRRKVCEGLAARNRKPAGDSVYARLRAAGGKGGRGTGGADLGRRIMESRNPNYKR